MKPLHAASLALFFLVVGTGPLASAQSTKPTKPAKPGAAAAADAKGLKASADALMDDHRYAEALALYMQAHQLSGDPALLYNQARALEAMGEYPDALERLERFDREAPPALRARVPGLGDLMTDLRGRIATLVVRTNVAAARLLVREKAIGEVAGERTVKTRAGTATIEVVAEGYEPFRREVELSAGATEVVDAQLVAKKVDALVVVRTRPDADVSVDGKAMGRAPLDLHMTSGSHVLVARAPGYDDEKVAMNLALGDRRELDLGLHKTPPITAKWWFWTGIGVIVAGGAATAFALTTERSHSHGSIGDVAFP